MRPISNYKNKLEQQLRVDSEVSPTQIYKTANAIADNYKMAGLQEEAKAYYRIAANAYFLYLEQIDWEHYTDVRERGDKFFRAATLFWNSEETSYGTFFQAALGYYRQGYELENIDHAVACYHGGAVCQLILNDVQSALSAAIMAYQLEETILKPLTNVIINIIHNYHTDPDNSYPESRKLFENYVSESGDVLNTKELFPLSIMIDFLRHTQFSLVGKDKHFFKRKSE